MPHNSAHRTAFEPCCQLAFSVTHAFHTACADFAADHSPWDNRSAFLDEKTLDVLDEPLPASLILLTSEHELELARILDAKDGIMVMNGAPHTRSWFRNALTAQNPTVNENENSELWRAHHVQLYTPVMLTRYGGNKIDPDPRYNYTTECAGPTADERRVCFTDICRCVHDHLDFGTLSMTYGALWHNDKRENVYAHMMPTTAVEIGEGYVIGLERVVTKRSGTYTAPSKPDVDHPGKELQSRGSVVHYYNSECMKSRQEKGGPVVTVSLSLREIAVIVWD